MADQDKNPGTKQGDGDASESFRANPSDKQGSGSTGGRSGRSGQSDGMDKSKSGTGGSGTDSGYKAGSKDMENDTDIERPHDNRGGSGSGRSSPASR